MPGGNGAGPVVVGVEADGIVIEAVLLRMLEQVERVAEAVADSRPVVRRCELPESEEGHVGLVLELRPLAKGQRRGRKAAATIAPGLGSEECLVVISGDYLVFHVDQRARNSRV